jgi:phage protein U
MALIGSYGNVITFGVFDPYNDWGSRSLVRPEEVKRKTTARWAEYPLIKNKPLMEFQGPALDEFSLDVKLSADYGVTPAEVIDAIRAHIRKGLAEFLVIGGRNVGDNPYIIEEMSETWDELWNEGQLFSATVSLSFKEYIRKAPKGKKGKSSKNSKKKKKKNKGKNGSGSSGGNKKGGATK